MTALSQPTRITLGTAQLGMSYGVANRSGQPSRPEAFRLLELALELGVRSFDTAPAYGDAEARLGEFFRAHGVKEIFVTTKLSAIAPEADVDAQVEAQVHASLDRLGVSRIDAYLLHRTGDLEQHGQRLVAALLRQQRAGVLGRIGVSIYGPDEALAARDVPQLSAIQFPFNLLDQRMSADGLLTGLRSRGVLTFARSAYLQGLLTLPPDALPRRMAHAAPVLRELGAHLGSHGLDPASVALPFVAATPGIDSVVVGMEGPEQLVANVHALEHVLPATLAEELRVKFAAVDPAIVDPRRWPEGVSACAS